jgi:DNA-binding MurR/RpiR family transcriptional regulator
MGSQPTLDQLLQGRRLTPAHRRIAQILISHSDEIGFMSSPELARLSSVSQPSMSRFAAALGFSGFTEMRDYFRTLAKRSPETLHSQKSQNKYTAAIAAEAQNIFSLAAGFSDTDRIRAAGKLLASSKPLPVLGLRASSGLAQQFSYFGAKIHPDIRPITDGGSMVGDLLEQCRDAGATCVLAFALPLYPRETTQGMSYAKDLGLTVIAVADSAFKFRKNLVDHLFAGNLYSGLVFDSPATASLLMAFLLEAMCDAIPEAERRLQMREKFSRQRKVFEPG